MIKECKIVKRGYESERERQLILQSEGWYVLRVSGSIGALDLSCVKAGVVGDLPTMFYVKFEQVKSTKDKTFYFDKESKWELERLKEIFDKFHIPCFFSIKFKRKGWIIKNVKELDGKPIKFIS